MEADAYKPSKELAFVLFEKLGIPEPECDQWVNFARGVAEFPRKNSISPTGNQRTNLPLSLTSFIGRVKEQTEITKLLENNRLVTLTGVGGIGKTRLSIQVASRLLNDFPDGVWLAEFASLSDPTLVQQVVGKALGLIDQGNRPPINILTDFLRAKRVLIIFDNCEHLIQACAELAEALLRACPGLKILGTSRKALDIDVEIVCLVSSLTTPDALHTTLDDLPNYEAAQLFLERTQSAMVDFRLTQENAAAIVHVCQYLDGIPLSIELAAAKIRVLSMEQIAKRLEDRFQLLTGGSRTALERHQTLRAAIDWSYNLLTEPEQLLLRRLSVFVGGWTLGAAESVCGFEGIEASDVLGLLTHLVDKSLVTVAIHAVEVRYHMLETIRQYAREKLIESGESDALRQKHGNWFLKLAESIDHELLLRYDEMRWLNQLENDLDNFRAALFYFQVNHKSEECAWLASKIGLFWLHRNYFAEGRHWLETGLAHRATLSKTTTAHALRILGRLLARMGDYDKGIKYGKESVALFRSLGDSFELAVAVEFLGKIVSENGDDVALTCRPSGHRRQSNEQTIKTSKTEL